MDVKLFRSVFPSAVAMLGLCGVTAPAAADSITYGFELVTQGAAPVPGASYILTVSNQTRGNLALPDNQVRFSLTNPGGFGSIHEVYFDDAPSPLLLSSATKPLSPVVTDSDGPIVMETKKNGAARVIGGDQVNFIWGSADPAHLPGGGNATPPFEVSAGFLADIDGSNGAGVNSAQEWLDLTFVLTGSNTYASVIAALESRALRVGLHVGDSTGTSGNPESGAWVTPGGPGPGPGPTPVPLPATAMAALGLLGGWTLVGRRRRS